MRLKGAPRCMMCGHWASAPRLIRPQFHLEQQSQRPPERLRRKMTNYRVELSAPNNFKTLRETRGEGAANRGGKKAPGSYWLAHLCVFEEEIESSVSYKRLSALDKEPITVVPFICSAFAGIKKRAKKKKGSVRNTHPQASTLTDSFSPDQYSHWYFYFEIHRPLLGSELGGWNLQNQSGSSGLLFLLPP